MQEAAACLLQLGTSGEGDNEKESQATRKSI